MQTLGKDDQRRASADGHQQAQEEHEANGGLTQGRQNDVAEEGLNSYGHDSLTSVGVAGR